MSKYDPLRHHLVKRQSDRWVASFSDVEGILGFHLPDSARKRHEWWGNEKGEKSHVQARAWLHAGWKTTEVDLSRERVTFVRDAIA